MAWEIMHHRSTLPAYFQHAIGCTFRNPRLKPGAFMFDAFSILVSDFRIPRIPSSDTAPSLACGASLLLGSMEPTRVARNLFRVCRNGICPVHSRLKSRAMRQSRATAVHLLCSLKNDRYALPENTSWMSSIPRIMQPTVGLYQNSQTIG